MGRFFWNPSEERAAFYRHKREQVTRRRASEDDLRTWKSANARDLRRAYPWLSPNVIVKMTRDGYDVKKAENIALTLATPMMNRQRALEADGIGDDETTENAKAKRQSNRRLNLRAPSDPVVRPPSMPVAQPFLGPGPLRHDEGGGFLDDIGEGIGDVFGFVADKDPSGDPLDLAAKAPGPPGEIARTAKGAVRAGLIGLQSGFEALQGAGRSAPPSLTEALGVDAGRAAGGTQPWLSGNPTRRFLQDVGEQTTAGQAIKALVEGRRVDTGTGVLPDPQSQVGLAQSRATRKAWSIGGQGATLGRFVASTVAEPGSTEYRYLSGLTDAVNITLADPANIALGGIGRLNQARKEIRAAPLLDDAERTAGGIRTAIPLDPSEQIIEAGGRPWWRRAVQGPTADEYLASPGAVALNAELATISSPATLWRRLEGVPVTTSRGENFLRSMADADTPEKVADVWRRSLGVDVERIPKLKAESRMPDVRMLGMKPGETVSFRDLEKSLHVVESNLLNGKVPIATRDRILDNMIRNADGGLMANPDRYDVVQDLAQVLTDQMVSYGAPPDFARKTARLWADEHTATRAYMTKAAADGTHVQGFMLDGKPVDFTQHPYLLTQMLNSSVEMPDWRAIKKATSEFSAFFSNPAVELGTDLADAYMRKWKAFILIKPNLALRVVGEQQLRQAASGFTDMFSHPAKMMSVMAGAKVDHPWMRAVLRQIPGVSDEAAGRATSNIGSFVADSAGHPFQGELTDPTSAYRRALQDTFIDFRGDQRKLHLDDWIPDVPRTSETWGEGLVIELDQLRDPVTRAIAGGKVAGEVLDTPGAIKEAFWSGDLKSAREALAKQDFFEDLATSRAAADRYIDGSYDYVREITRHDPRLMEAIRSGRFEGKPIIDQWGNINPKVAGRFNELKMAPDFGPDAVKWRKEVTIKGLGRGNDRLDRMLDKGFSTFLLKPSDAFSRNTVFREAMWQDVERTMPYLIPDDQARVLANAVEARVPKSDVERMSRIKSVVDEADPRRLTIEQQRLAGHAKGLETVKNLLYDLSERRQYEDMVRNFIPFLPAWKEVIGRWAKITAANPSVVRTVAKDLAGLRAAGVFHVDEETGQEVYSIPGTGWLNDQLFGVPVPLNASVEGLNLASSGLPGAGPMVTIPASFLIPDDPSFDPLKKALFPFGDIQKSGDPFSDIVLAGLPVPNWMRRAWSAFRDPDSYRDQANATGHIMRYLASTGDYDLDGRDGKDPRAEMRRLVADAKDKAQGFGIIRAIALAMAPSAPIPEWNVKDKQGNLVLAQQLAKDYQKMLTKSGGDADKALGKWIEKYGTDNLLTLQAFSEPVKGYLPATTESLDWLRNHPAVREKHPEVYGFFAPGAKGDFDINAFARSFDRDEREPLTPEEMVKASNARIGSYLYRQAQREVGDSPSDADREWLRDYKDALTEDYPGYNEHGGGFLKTPTLVRRIREALTDPTLKATEAGVAARKFLTEYDRAIRDAKKRGYTTLSSKAMRPLRTWLNDYGEALVDDYPDFENLWVYGFSALTRSD